MVPWTTGGEEILVDMGGSELQVRVLGLGFRGHRGILPHGLLIVQGREGIAGFLSPSCAGRGASMFSCRTGGGRSTLSNSGGALLLPRATGSRRPQIARSIPISLESPQRPERTLHSKAEVPTTDRELKQGSKTPQTTFLQFLKLHV